MCATESLPWSSLGFIKKIFHLAIQLPASVDGDDKFVP